MLCGLSNVLSANLRTSGYASKGTGAVAAALNVAILVFLPQRFLCLKFLSQKNFMKVNHDVSTGEKIGKLLLVAWWSWEGGLSSGREMKNRHHHAETDIR